MGLLLALLPVCPHFFPAPKHHPPLADASPEALLDYYLSFSCSLRSLRYRSLRWVAGCWSSTGLPVVYLELMLHSWLHQALMIRRRFVNSWKWWEGVSKGKISTATTRIFQDPKSSGVLLGKNKSTRCKRVPQQEKTATLCIKAGGLLWNWCLYIKKRWIHDMKLIRIITFSIWLLHQLEYELSMFFQLIRDVCPLSEPPGSITF